MNYELDQQRGLINITPEGVFRPVEFQDEHNGVTDINDLNRRARNRALVERDAGKPYPREIAVAMARAKTSAKRSQRRQNG